MAITKVDLLREHRELYVPRREPALVVVPEFTFLMVDGHGDPEASTQGAIHAIYGAAYKLRFALKRAPFELDARVMPLEGLWWMPDMARFTLARKSEWDWTLMLRVPETVDTEVLASLDIDESIRLERWEEGDAVQLMHVGPYTAEQPSIERLHAFIEEQGLERRGKHHEIYLGDPRRAAPEKLRTVLRQPVRAR